MRGSGTDAGTFALLGAGRGARVHRLVVRDTPERAVAHAVDALVDQGFVPAPAQLEAALTRRAPAWTTRVVEIGDDAATWRQGVRAFLADLVTFELAGDLLHRKVEKTWVVVTARQRTGGATEVVLGPVVRGSGQTGGGGTTARPWLDAGVAVLVQGYTAPGLLLEAPAVTRFVTDEDSPALIRTFRQVVKELRRSGTSV